MVNKQIGERIKKRRKELGLTQEELAKRLNINNRSAITRYEKGEKTFKQSQIVSLANALETTPSYLMGWEDENNKKDNIYNGIGRNIKELRESRHITANEMASEFNISIDDLNKYEKGLKEIPLETLRAFAIYFDTTIDELISIDVAGKRATFITKDKTLSERYSKWQNMIGYDFKFTDEEIDEIINFARYLISKRKEK